MTTETVTEFEVAAAAYHEQAREVRRLAMELIDHDMAIDDLRALIAYRRIEVEGSDEVQVSPVGEDGKRTPTNEQTRAARAQAILMADEDYARWRGELRAAEYRRGELAVSLEYARNLRSLAKRRMDAQIVAVRDDE